MAKINKKGCHAVASLTFEDAKCRQRYVLRSDGAILSGTAYPYHSIKNDGTPATVWPSISLYIAWKPGTVADPHARMLEIVNHAILAGNRVITRKGI